MMALRGAFLPVAALAAMVPFSGPVAAPQAGPAELSGTLASGARWRAEVPANWNGTLLLWSRGYSRGAGEPEAAPPRMREALLAEGYALAGSNYGAGGWALEQAVPAQRATLAAFAAAHRAPARVIAWGYSMGGLVSIALAEQRPAGVSAALPMCSSMGGAVGMMNMALDGAYAFRTLIAPDAGILLVDIDDDMANSGRVRTALDAALRTPEGRARVALAGVLGGIPGWTSPDRAEPGAGDIEAQLDEIGRSFVMGVFLPRTDQEKRAGGGFSWNTGIDYRAQLARSGRRSFVEAMYRKAGIDLEADLKRLNAGQRVAARPGAVDYMMRHYTPNARPGVPVLAVQTIGDGLTSPSLQRGYADAARGPKVRSLFVRAAGHCTFKPDTVVASIRYLDRRLQSGRWGERPASFVAHTPPPMLRPCVRNGRCR
jgi:pimeloyl-ACP methyl ester carboxylesterase